MKEHTTSSRLALISVLSPAMITSGHAGKRKKREHMSSSHSKPKRFHDPYTIGTPVTKCHQVLVSLSST